MELEESAISPDAESLSLTEADVPGAFLSEPMASHTTPQLRWWLFCRGVKAPTSWNKTKLLSRYAPMSDMSIQCQTPHRHWPWIVYIVCCYGATANSQLTINPKNRKCILWDPDPRPSYTLYQPCHLK